VSESPLFTYSMATEPAPVQVSTATYPATARLDVGVLAPPPAAGGAPIAYCSNLLVAVPVAGPGALLSGPVASVSTTRWSVGEAPVIRSPGEPGWPDLAAGADPLTTYAKFLYTCAEPADYAIGYPLALGISGTVVEVAGETSILIRETSGTLPNGPFTEKAAVLALGTTGSQFFLENLMAAAPPPGDPTVPCTAFAAMAPVRLSWESNGTWFQVFTGGSATAAWDGADTFCDLAGFTVDTTVILVASVTAPPGQSSAGYEPVYRYATLTITITGPALTPTSVVVSGQLQAATADVQGMLRADQATFNLITATGAASIAHLNVGILRPDTGFDATAAAVSALTAPTQIGYGSNEVSTELGSVSTDGLAVLQLMPPSSSTQQECLGYGWIKVGGNGFGVSGGTRSIGGGSLVPDVHCVMVPIPAYTSWSFGVNPLSANSPCPTWQLYWFPLGQGPAPS
jgi:hypothetical protein